MGASGCSSCQFGGQKALRAYDQTLEVRQRQKPVQLPKLPGETAGYVVNIGA